MDAEITVPKTMDNFLTMAIQQGVPLYNRGDADACAAVYETALNGLLLLSEDQITDEAETIIASSLQESASAGDADEKAWALRRGIDKLLK